MYFDKLMRITTSTCLETSTNTMHQHVAGSVTPRMTMRMLSDKLDGGAISMDLVAIEERVHFNNISLLSAQTPSQMTKLGISSAPSTITRMSKSLSHHNGLSLSDVLHGFLKPFYLTWVHVHCNVTSCQVQVQVSMVGCNSHRVDEES